MKKKKTLHIFTVTCLVVFILFCFACRTLTPEEQAQYAAQQAQRESERASDGKGGTIVVKLVDGKNDAAYQVVRPEIDRDFLNDGKTFTHKELNHRSVYNTSYSWIVDEDGLYTIWIRNLRTHPFRINEGSRKDNYWSKTVYVSNDGTFVVNVP